MDSFVSPFAVALYGARALFGVGLVVAWVCRPLLRRGGGSR